MQVDDLNGSFRLRALSIVGCLSLLEELLGYSLVCSYLGCALVGLVTVLLAGQGRYDMVRQVEGDIECLLLRLG